MDPKRLLIFRAIARAGSISAAAREFGWTQPALSQHLGALEREAGTPLVLRGPHGVTLTEAGHILLRRADAVAGQLDLAAEELAAVARLRRGRVRLAAYPSALATIVPRAAASLRNRLPEADITLVEAEPPEALALLGRGDVDLALVFGYEQGSDHIGRACRRLGEEPVRLVTAAGGHPANGPLTLADLRDEEWVVGCDRCRDHLLDLCRNAGFEPIERHSTDDYVVRQNLVAAGFGVTLLPQAALDAYRHPDVVVRGDPRLGRRELHVVYHDGAEQVPATAALLHELGTAWRTQAERNR
ncbi:LysR family transcriptional regulator [Amycolatopsis sp. SID8362]|uniref:LysR family transcriptional regulator n=1 Tax=Amycolatopsis sp. SID8362 TaxID=2690346 RepID=UPI00136F3F24|nr:LysR family transcriptional regulator [Amycolatopsis sp. SID8362]NBH07730.1 LysR family transcriptional regulator [Amycolatopsis sp. SID8362]NED44425.1 LysR family transcriptional regulator [Amycolatopsis sp. SID8362]